MYSQRGKKYIYSVERANEFIQRGYRCIETGFNAKQQRFFWVFNYDEVQDYYNDKWISIFEHQNIHNLEILNRIF